MEERAKQRAERRREIEEMKRKREEEKLVSVHSLFRVQVGCVENMEGVLPKGNVGLRL